MENEINDANFEREKSSKFQKFDELLQSIESVDSKTKQLWKEIYENAIIDRQNAYVMFVKLAQLCENKSGELAVHGTNMTKFHERMGRANDQLIKLAELIGESSAEKTKIDPDEIFNQIRKR